MRCSNMCSVNGLLVNFMEPFTNFGFHFSHTARLFCGSGFFCIHNRRNLFGTGNVLILLSQKKSSLNSNLVSTTNIVTGNKVLERRVNRSAVNGCRGDERGTLTRLVRSLRGSEGKKKVCGRGRKGRVCVCVCARTLSLTYLVLVGSIGLQRRTVTEGDTRAHGVCFGHRWNQSKTITAFLCLQVVNAAESLELVRQHYERRV